ncbi:MAG: c-type cytochrome, partial [Ginsengibacter sp.]
MRKIIFTGLLFIAITFLVIFNLPKKNDKKDTSSEVLRFNKDWVAPDTSLIAHNAEGDMIRYGRKLIVHTAEFFGPHGSIKHISNGMNCENCHADAGTK